MNEFDLRNFLYNNPLLEATKKGNEEEEKREEGAIADDRDHIDALDADAEADADADEDADDHADVEIVLLPQGFRIFTGDRSDLGGVVDPILHSLASSGAGIGDLIVAGEAAHLPEDGNSLVDVAFDLIWSERFESYLACGASPLAPGREGDFIIEF